jgi:hypothetical protein
MTNQPRTLRWIAWTALGGVLTLCALSLAANSWGQAATAPVGKGASPAPGSNFDDVQARDRLEVLEAQLEAKRTLVQIDESRAEEAKRWRDYYEKRFQEGKAVANRVLATRDDDLLLDAHVMSKRADLKVAEIHLKYARQRVANPGQADTRAAQAREELEVLNAQLEAKRGLLRVAEARAEQAKQTATQYEKLFRDRLATEEMVITAKDNVLLMDALLAWGRADLKVAELRVTQAQRAAESGGATANSLVSEMSELEDRLAMSEMKTDVLQHEVGRLRRALRREAQGAR